MTGVALQHEQLSLACGGPSDLGVDGIDSLASLPYRREPYCRRNWGHPFHAMCSYPSKIKPGIAHFLVRLFTKPGESVLDPFCGVGTIPFEACNQGRQGFGSDLNPLAATVTHAKVAPPSRHEVEELLAEVESAVHARPNGALVEEEIASFFHRATLAEVIAARTVLLHASQCEADQRRRAAAFLLSCLAHILHGNRPYALSRRSHNVIPIAPKGEFVYKPVLPPLREKVNRLMAVPLSASFRTGAAACLPFAHASAFVKQVDHVITSPPFLGTTHFVRQNRVRLWLCGWDYGFQEEVKPHFLEHQRGLEAYSVIFETFTRVIRKTGSCVLHLGVVKNVDMAAAIAPYALQAGFAVEGIVYENAAHLETHGRTDRGGTHSHQFLALRKN